MIPIIIIISGVVFALIGAVKLLNFISQFSDLIKDLNYIYSGDVHKFNKNLRTELDELNYSYYEILERQDERISKLELMNGSKGGAEASAEPAVEAELVSNSVTNSEKIQVEELSEDELNKKRILSLFERGMKVSEIAETLNIPYGTVDLICSLYGRG